MGIIKKGLFFFFGIFSILSMKGQQTIIKGSVKNGVTFEPITKVLITIEETNQSTETNTKGEFLFNEDVPLGEQILRISKEGFITKRYPIIVNEFKTVDISDMTLELDVSSSQDLFTITLSDDELDNDESGLGNISGLLQSSLDIFQRTVAFEFSPSFFRLREAFYLIIVLTF